MNRQPSDLYILARRAYKNSVRWFGQEPTDDKLHMAVGLGGEVGELLNVIKKIDRGDFEVGSARAQFALGSEMADVLTYLLLISAQYEIDLQAAYAQKEIENERRFNKENPTARSALIVDGIEVKRK